MFKHKLKCFISYSHKDTDMMDKFLTHFKCLSRIVDTKVWYDGKIPAGGQISNEVFEQLKIADVVFLLITPDYIASEWCYTKEMGFALERNKKGECIVIPVMIKKIISGTFPFDNLKIVPTDKKAISSFKSRDDGFVDAFNLIKISLQRFCEDNNKTTLDEFATIKQKNIKDKKISLSTTYKHKKWNYNIIILDDVEDQLEMLENQINLLVDKEERYGVRIFCATKATEVIYNSQNIDIDVFILDVARKGSIKWQTRNFDYFGYDLYNQLITEKPNVLVKSKFYILSKLPEETVLKEFDGADIVYLSKQTHSNEEVAKIVKEYLDSIYRNTKQ